MCSSGGAYLRPVRGCIRAGCEVAAAAAGCLGLLTFVLLFANSKRMVCGISGSNLTPCCKESPKLVKWKGVTVVRKGWLGWGHSSQNHALSHTRTYTLCCQNVSGGALVALEKLPYSSLFSICTLINQCGQCRV